MVNIKNPIFAGIIGGFLIALITFLSDRKETALAAIIATIPLIELFPILFTNPDSISRLSRDTVVTSISTISSLLITYIAISLWKLHPNIAVICGFISWFIIALCLYYFFITKKV